jgi:hypothetical protein
MKGCTLPDCEIGEVHIRSSKDQNASNELKRLRLLGQEDEILAELGTPDANFLENVV